MKEGRESLVVSPQARDQSKKKQASDNWNYSNPQKSADSVPSKYTKKYTTELNFISETSASPTNSTSQKANLGLI